MRKRWRQGFIVLAAGAAIALMAAPDRASAASFEGNWSLLVITESGTCDRAYRYPIKVQSGQIHYTGEAGIDIHGNVGQDGKINASVRRGDQGATGSGQLTQTAGTGNWAGRSATGACNGRWEAERR